MVMTFCTYQKVLEGQVPHLLLVALAGWLLRQGPGRAEPLLMGLLDSPVLPPALHTHAEPFELYLALLELYLSFT